MGSLISFTAGLALLISCFAVMWVYRPKKNWGKTPQGVLGMAIFLSFFGSATNTMWWQILGNTNAHLDVISVLNFREIGLFLDGVFKGSIALAACLHLEAVRRSLPEPERSQNRWWKVPLLAGRGRWLARITILIQRRD